MTRMRKGDAVEAVAFLIMGILAALIVFVAIQRGVTNTLHTKCVADMEKTVDNIQSFTERINAENEPISIPVTLGTCVDAIIFTNHADLTQSLSKAGVNLDNVFACPKYYKSAIIGAPDMDGIKGGFWSGIKDALTKKDYKKLTNAGAGIVGLDLKVYCKSLNKPEYTFKDAVELLGSKTDEKKYCLTVTMLKDGVFSIDKSEFKNDQECKNDIQLPIV